MHQTAFISIASRSFLRSATEATTETHSAMLIWPYLSLLSGFHLIYAHTCRSLFLAFKTDLPQRSYASYTDDTCWDQCYAVREDLALILNNGAHSQYDWCLPDHSSGLCIIDQAIQVVTNKDFTNSIDETICNCTVLLRFPRILQENQKDKYGNSCKVQDIQTRIQRPKRGRYTDFPVKWVPAQITVKKKNGKTETLDHSESGENVECAVNWNNYAEFCGWRGQCLKQLWWGHHKTRCEHINYDGLNLVDTVKSGQFYQTDKIMDFLQLDYNKKNLPVIPYM